MNTLLFLIEYVVVVPEEKMEVEDKLETLVAGARFDVCGSHNAVRPAAGSPLRFIHRAGGWKSPDLLCRIWCRGKEANSITYLDKRIGRQARREVLALLPSLGRC